MFIPTSEKIEEMKQNDESLTCLGCLGFVDDGKHEYDAENDLFFCPALDEVEVDENGEEIIRCDYCDEVIEDKKNAVKVEDGAFIYRYCTKECEEEA